METYQLNNDISIFCVTAESFPTGIAAAWQKLHSLFAEPMGRKYFGISYPAENGTIIYKAATEELNRGEGASHGCETFVIKKGKYISAVIPGFMKEVQAIGKTFQQMIADPRIDPGGVCVEEYFNATDVRCMVRLRSTESV